MEVPCVLLQVFHFLSPAEVLSTVALVNRYWEETAASDTLWEEFLTRLGRKKGEESAKAAYRLLLRPYIPVVTNTTLRIFDLTSLCWSRIPLSSPVKLTYFMSIARLADCQLFVTGANLPLDTFQIDSLSGLITALESLPTHRNNIGLIRDNNQIYAFCGYASIFLSTCEKYDIATKSWESLPEALSPRASFNPTVHKTLIYLLGGWSSGECEVFSTVSHHFAPLSLSLPPNAFVCTWWEADTLLCIEKSGVYRWVEGTEQTWQRTKRAFDLGVVPWSSFKVTVYRGCVYLLEVFSCKIVKMDTSTYEHWDLPVPDLGTGLN